MYCNFREKLGQDELEAKKKEKMGLDDSLAEIRVVFFLIFFSFIIFNLNRISWTTTLAKFALVSATCRFE
jgi:hypothetical protein